MRFFRFFSFFDRKIAVSCCLSINGSAYGNRTRLSALRGPCPNRIDERAEAHIAYPLTCGCQSRPALPAARPCQRRGLASDEVVRSGLADGAPVSDPARTVGVPLVKASPPGTGRL